MNLFFNSAVLAACLLGSQACIGGTMGPIESKSSYDGFYFGGDIGASDLMVRETTLVPQATHTLGSLGVVGGGLVGYDYSISNYIKLGLEGFINAAGLNVAAEQNYGARPSYRARMRYDAGFRLLPGYEFSPGTVGHVLIAYANGRFNIRDNGNYGFISNSFNRSGIQGGLGLKTMLSKRLALRGDVLYSYYGSSTSYGLTSTTPQVVQTYQNRFATFEGDLTLVYKFC